MKNLEIAYSIYNIINVRKMRILSDDVHVHGLHWALGVACSWAGDGWRKCHFLLDANLLAVRVIYAIL